MTINTINWGNLVANGRAKAFGIAWSEEESAARALGIPAEFVREGILTLKEYEKAKVKDEQTTQENGEKPVSRMNSAELKAKATELGLEFGPDATNSSLKEIINLKLEEEARKSDSDSDTDE